MCLNVILTKKITLGECNYISKQSWWIALQFLIFTVWLKILWVIIILALWNWPWYFNIRGFSPPPPTSLSTWFVIGCFFTPLPAHFQSWFQHICDFFRLPVRHAAAILACTEVPNQGSLETLPATLPLAGSSARVENPPQIKACAWAVFTWQTRFTFRPAICPHIGWWSKRARSDQHISPLHAGLTLPIL